MTCWPVHPVTADDPRGEDCIPQRWTVVSGQPCTLEEDTSDQGNCPDGHPCHLTADGALRECDGGEYRGLPLGQLR